MADATITVAIGAQSASFTIPDAAVQRVIPMLEERWRPYHPAADPSLLQVFAAGLKNAIRRAVLRHEKSSFVVDPIDLGSDP